MYLRLQLAVCAGDNAGISVGGVCQQLRQSVHLLLLQ